jgi:hypothetical protein
MKYYNSMMYIHYNDDSVVDNMYGNMYSLLHTFPYLTICTSIYRYNMFVVDRDEK